MLHLPRHAKPYPNCYLILVTPEMAREWLKNNNFNRPLRPRLVDHYVRQILAGSWHRTHQGIAFDCNGVILDGQHRLHAIIRTGRMMPMLIFLNEEQSVHESIDNGKPRTLLDVVRLELRDNTIKGQHIYVLKWMWAGRFCKNQNDMTASEAASMLRRFGDAVRFAVDMADVPGPNDNVVLGVIARAYQTIPQEQLLEFCRILRGYDSDHPTAGLILEYRNWLLRLRDRQEPTRRDVYKRTEMVLNAFLKGETTCDFFREQRELFPIYGNRPE